MTGERETKRMTYRKVTVAIAALGIVAGAGATACSNDSRPAPATAQATSIKGQADTTWRDVSYPQGPVDSEFKIWDSSDNSMQTVAITNPRVVDIDINEADGGTANWAFDATVTQRQGTGAVGRFYALLSDKHKIDQVPAYANIDGDNGDLPWGDQLVPSQIVDGYVAFVVPPGTHVTKVFYNSGYETKAEWDL